MSMRDRIAKTLLGGEGRLAPKPQYTAEQWPLELAERQKGWDAFNAQWMGSLEADRARLQGMGRTPATANLERTPTGEIVTREVPITMAPYSAGWPR